MSPVQHQSILSHATPCSSSFGRCLGCGRDARIAALSTIFLMVNLLIALSLGVQREQLEQRMGFTWPRPFLLRPLFSSLAPHRLPGLGGDFGVLGRSLLDHICGCCVRISKSLELADIVVRSEEGDGGTCRRRRCSLLRPNSRECGLGTRLRSGRRLRQAETLSRALLTAGVRVFPRFEHLAASELDAAAHRTLHCSTLVTIYCTTRSTCRQRAQCEARRKAAPPHPSLTAPPTSPSHAPNSSRPSARPARRSARAGRSSRSAMR